jgi:superoxide dismutase
VFESKTVEPTKLPKDFPASIPLETGAKMVDNYNSTAEDGTYQATRVFESKKTLSQNFSLYEAFLKQDGWKLLATKDDEKLKVLSASKDNGMLQISMTQGTTGIVLVNISYTVK